MSVNELLWGWGFNLEIHLYEAGRYDAVYEFMREEQDAVFVAPYGWAERLYDHLERNVYRLQDLTGPVQAFLPDIYMSVRELGLDFGGSVYLLPTALQPRRIHPLPVFIRTDIYESYGRPIHDIDGYSDFLRWLRERGHAGAAMTWTCFSNTRNTVLPLDLFMPRLGYAPLDGIFRQSAGIDSHLWMDGEGRIAAWYEFDDAALAFAEYMEWHHQGLVGFVNPAGTAAAPGTVTTFGRFYTLNHSAFTAIALPEAAQWGADAHYAAFALPDADITEFIRLYQYLLTDSSAYIEFTVGSEGVDYEYAETGGEVQFRQIMDLDRLQIMNYTRMFIQTTKHNEIIYGTIIRLPPPPAANPPDYPLSGGQRRDVGIALLYDREYQAFVSEMNRYLTAFFNSLYTNPDNAIPFSQVMADIRAMPGSDIATRLANEARGG
jgi:hypothetical protein